MRLYLEFKESAPKEWQKLDDEIGGCRRSVDALMVVVFYRCAKKPIVPGQRKL